MSERPWLAAVGVFAALCVVVTVWASISQPSRIIARTSPRARPPLRPTFLTSRFRTPGQPSWWSLRRAVVDWL